jgi:protein-S-isoprenylcysteine O-methyltransferase
MVFWMLFFDQFAVGFLLSRIVPDGMAVGLVGILITLAGLGFAVWARIHLGKYWSYMPEIKVNHKLIRTGPYQLVRHPIYTGILFAFAGTAIVIGEVWALFAILMMLAAFLGKIWWEEKVLLEEFGEEYVRYKEEVKALIPFVV